MGADDLLCSRNARSRTPLVGRAQWKINQPPSLERKRADWKDGTGVARCPSCSQNAHIQKVLAWDKSASRRAQGWAGEKVTRSKGQPRPLPPILEKRGRGKRKGPGDSLCSRNARLQTPLVGHAHVMKT